MTYRPGHPRYHLYIPPRTQADWRWLEYLLTIPYTEWINHDHETN